MSAATSRSVTCATCGDTRRMSVRLRSGDEALWNCTHCPIPCERCVTRGKNGGAGMYCAAIPCPCACHEKKAE